MREVPLTASRAVKLALTRSAERSIGLVVTVDTVSEETKPFDALLKALSDDMVLLWLDKNGEHTGILALDREMSAAIVEMRTLRRVRDTQGSDRRPTSADIALAQPLFVKLLDELHKTTGNTVLDGWTDAVVPASRVPSVREVGLALPDNTFRYMTMHVDLGAGDRKGKMWIALPDTRAAPAASLPADKNVDWAKEMNETVMEAPVILDAILHRSKFPLSLLAGLVEGQVVPLPGCSVSSVRMEALDGTTVARGRIGQMAGNIAVRVETPKGSLMTDLGSFGDEMPRQRDMMALADDTLPMDDGIDALPLDDPLAGGTEDAFDPAAMPVDIPPMEGVPDFPMDAGGLDTPIGTEMEGLPMEGLPDFPSEDET